MANLANHYRRLGDIENANEDSGKDFTYEHFPVMCPSCQGLGVIENRQDGMVTFVPVKDERLQPARLKLKIGCLLLFVLVSGGLGALFLHPREVILKVVDYEALAWDLYGDSPWIVMEFGLEAYNSNFYGVSLNSTVVEVLYQQTIVDRHSVNVPVEIHIRERKKIRVVMNVTYPAAQPYSPGKYLKRQCLEKRMFVAHCITATSQLSTWIHDQPVSSEEEYFFLDCSKMIFPLPTSTADPVSFYATPARTASLAYEPVTIVKRE